jgi:hypothetical protein
MVYPFKWRVGLFKTKGGKIKMSLNTFNIIHIVVEVVTILSITAYFLHQNSKIMSRIDTLNSTIEEYEEKFGEQDKKINGILKSLKKIESKMESNTASKEKEKEKEKTVEDDSGSVCKDGVCSLPASFGAGFQIPIQMPPFKHFFEKQPSFFSQVQEIILEENDEDEGKDEEVKVMPYDDEEEEDDAPEDVIVEIEKEKVSPPSPEPITPSIKIVEQNDSSSKKKKRKRKKNNSVSSVPDLDKELEDELNELNAM